MKEYNINDVTEIAEAIKSGDRVENDIGTVIDGFFWFPEEIQWAAQWQKDEEQDSPYDYFAMLLNHDVFKDIIDDYEPIIQPEDIKCKENEEDIKWTAKFMRKYGNKCDPRMN